VFDCFEHGNETNELQIKYFSEEPSASKDAEIVLKHSVLQNVCHYNFVHSFVTESFARYINDLLLQFLFLLQVLLLMLCFVGGNTREVTAKQMDGSLSLP